VAEEPDVLGGQVFCRACQSENQRILNGEIAIHFPGLAGVEGNRLGFFQATGLFELWLYGNLRFRIRIARIKERNCAI
jgi:hypothetical protein